MKRVIYISVFFFSFARIFATEDSHAAHERVLVVSGNARDRVVVAIGYKDSCPRQRCCPDNFFMRYEKLQMHQEHAHHSFHIPLKSQYGKDVVEVAIQTEGPFWEFYIPIDRLQQNEHNEIEIMSDQMILLKNSFGFKKISRGR